MTAVTDNLCFDSSSHPKFKVAICGSGIGGTALAYMIRYAMASSKEIDVHLYEAAPSFGEIGAGLGVWKRTLKLLESIGLSGGERGYERYATFPPADAPNIASTFRKSDQLNGVVYHEWRKEGGLTLLHRAKLLDLFASHIPDENVHFNKRLVSLSQSSSGVELKFGDGSSATADVLIGADGVNSLVRKHIFRSRLSTLDETEAERKRYLEKCMDSYWSRTIAYRFLINMDDLRALDPTHPSITKEHHFCGKRNHIVTYPIDGGKSLNFVTCNRLPDLEPGRDEERYEDCFPNPPTKEDLESLFVGWEPATQTLMKCIGAPTRWPILYCRPCNDWVDERVAAMGDAAHAMAPHNGAGAGMAIEDAFVLSAILTHPACTAKTLPLALKAYEMARIPPNHRAMHSSEACGLIYHFLGEHGDNLNELGGDIDELTRWIEEFDPVKIRVEATQIMLDLIEKEVETS